MVVVVGLEVAGVSGIRMVALVADVVLWLELAQIVPHH
jgi:hypothetical protein